MKKSFLICLLILFATPSLAHSEEPTDVLKNTVILGIAILKDPQYKVASKKEEQRELLCNTAGRVFDFREFSRRVLALKWQSFTPEEKKEFVEVFAEFLCKYYITRLQERYNDEKVIYLSQQFIGTRVARVRVNVLWKGLEVPVEVRMLKRNSTWKVYDIVVLGISGVMNYRAQFQDLFRNESLSQIIGRIRKRIKQEERRG
ncbi:MAG: ABC transporter substrate-binding protein [Deltaproteobacteria bacterium]|nr:ABC transporter substrate-binding protein [Deltaproteobacteria bacterium]